MRGHRVSNCQHADRPLQHINKKGRPVSQCTHCRTLRKSRSAHVRCECGEKAHAKGACTHDNDPQADICCCSHGTRCSCALKKEHLDPVPESDSDEANSTSTPANEKSGRPRALTAQSDNGLTSFVNGHHKPSHKNTIARTCGLPYVVPRAHSIHGPSPSGLANRSVDNLPHTNTVDALHSESHMKDSIVSAQQEQRMVKSEHGSPVLSGMASAEQWPGILPPLDLSNVSSDYVQGLDGVSGIRDQEAPLFSAGLSTASIDWSHYDGLEFNNDNFANSYSQAPSFNGFDFSSMDQPALTTTSTSGEISEVEEFPPMGDAGSSRPTLANNSKYGSEFDVSDFGGDVEGYRLSTASSYVGLPQTQMLASNNIDSLDMDSYMKAAPTSNGFTSSNNGLQTSSFSEEPKIGNNMSAFDDLNFTMVPTDADNDTFWMNNFSSNNMAANDGSGELPAENVWAQ